MAQIFNPNPGNTLDTVANALKEQANAANKDVNDAIKALQGTDNADNPALLAELQHKINKWSVIYNINSTVTRALRDLMQGILQEDLNMDTSLIRELAELALAGSGQHCHEEALCIAEWLERLGQDEAARLIRISSLANQGRYQEALVFAHGNPWPALEPWFALCEWHLGLGAALDRRLAGLGGSSDPALADFAAGMRVQVRT